MAGFTGATQESAELRCAEGATRKLLNLKSNQLPRAILVASAKISEWRADPPTFLAIRFN